MNEYVRRTLREALFVWIAVLCATIIAAIVYVVLMLAQVSGNISLLIAFFILAGLIILSFLPFSKSLFLHLITKETHHPGEREILTVQNNISVVLNEYWDKVEKINPENPDPEAITKAGQALDLTASLWNQNVLEKDMLYSQFWDTYQYYYNILSDIEASPTLIKSSPHVLSPGMKRAYEDMLQYSVQAAASPTIKSASKTSTTAPNKQKS